MASSTITSCARWHAATVWPSTVAVSFVSSGGGDRSTGGAVGGVDVFVCHRLGGVGTSHEGDTDGGSSRSSNPSSTSFTWFPDISHRLVSGIAPSASQERSPGLSGYPNMAMGGGPSTQISSAWSDNARRASSGQ